MPRLARVVGVTLSWVLIGCVVTGPGASADSGDAARGRVLFAAAAGCGCHTPDGGPVGAGGRELRTPFGTFYSTNITPDEQTGIGQWSAEEIDAAIRFGIVRDRGAETPVMPYYRFAGMADADAADLIAYLRTLPPVRKRNREHEINIPLPRVAFWGWRMLFARRPEPPAAPPREPLSRGRYLVDHVAICGDCHTPRNFVGASRTTLYLAGTAHGPDGETVPNITPDVRTGAGEWTIGDFAALLESGMKPDFDNVQGHMAELIEGHGGGPGYSSMGEGDRNAIAAYLVTVPPVANDVGDD